MASIFEDVVEMIHFPPSYVPPVPKESGSVRCPGYHPETRLQVEDRPWTLPAPTASPYAESR